MSLDQTLVMFHNKKSCVSEEYRTLRTNIMFSNRFNLPAVIAVTSTNPFEGKTTTCANLGLAFAQTKHKTIIIDCDMRKPSMHNLFGISRINGISNVLNQSSELKEAIIHIQEANLDIMPSGPVSDDPTELISSKVFNDVIENLKEKYDIILIDTPPVGILTDASLIATKADGVVMVVKEGYTRGRDFKYAYGSLKRVGAKIMGIVYNMMDISQNNGYGYKSNNGYKYGYVYGEDQGKIRGKLFKR